MQPDEEQRPRPEAQGPPPVERARRLAGFVIAGAALAALFGLAALKGRVKDQPVKRG